MSVSPSGYLSLGLFTPFESLGGRESPAFPLLLQPMPYIVACKCASTPSIPQHCCPLQVCGGSQSFNVVNVLRNLGRWMRMFVIPNQSSIPKAWTEFDEVG